MVPHTIASDTAQNTNSKNHLEPTVASEPEIAGKSAPFAVFTNVPWVPANQPAPPKASANPTAQ